MVAPGQDGDAVKTFVEVPKAKPGDRVAVLSPAFAAPAAAPAVHEQALRRLAEITGLIPVEYPTTRALGASAQARAQDLMDAFGDPTIRAVVATIGGDDQVTVIPFLDPSAMAADPKPFLGYSDNTNLHNLLWNAGVPSFYGGSTQVHLGAGPAVDRVHAQSLRAALMDGGSIRLTEPGMSEDFGLRWQDPRALRELGLQEPTEPWAWAGSATSVTARTWGGCVEVIDQLALADRLPSLDALEGSILLLETSEELPAADQVRRWVRGLGERGLISVLTGVLVARPPVSDFDSPPSTVESRAAKRAAQREVIIEQVLRYNPNAVVCLGVPFGHTSPQWIVPHGGEVTLDGASREVIAHYGSPRVRAAA